MICSLPQGISLYPLVINSDDRGSFTEVYRDSWQVGPRPLQWNFVCSAQNVLRGVHVHLKHSDYLILVAGKASIGLYDLRFDSATRDTSALVEMSADNLTALTIPPGVAHGFYFHTQSAHIYSVSEYWDPADELGCLWNDPDLGIQWPVSEVRLSRRDAALPSLKELLRRLEHSQEPCSVQQREGLGSASD